MSFLQKWLFVIHPLLFAVFFILALYSANVAEVSFSEIWILLFAALGLGLLLLLVALLLIGIIRKLQKPSNSSQPYQIWDPKKAAIVASFFLVLFFTFGHALRAIGGWEDLHGTIGDPSYWFALSILWIALLTVVAYFTVKTRRDLSKLTVLLSAVAATLVLISAVNIIINETKTPAQDTNGSENIVDLVKPDIPPDIYYIILDRYASARTLEEVFDFDNSEFINYLSDKGFYVANESVSNYPYTGPSLLSFLNMEFIHEGAAEAPISLSVQDYRVWRSLKSVGYEFIHFGSWLEATRRNPYADININYKAMPEFSSYLFRTTWAYPICLELNITDEWWEEQYERVLYKFERLAEIPEIEEPTFVFAHMLIPHPPYVFESDGSYLTPEEGAERSLEVRYVDQLIALNDMLRSLIDALLSRSDVAPIIILQADEGPYPGDEAAWKASGGLEDATEAELREKYGILNAYYLPGVNEDVLYLSITPVNSFRLIFNLYFGTDFELLPDNSYASYPDTPFEYIDVTDKLKDN